MSYQTNEEKTPLFRGVQKFENIYGEVRYLCTKGYDEPGKAKAQNTRHKRPYYYSKTEFQGYDKSVTPWRRIERTRNDQERLPLVDSWIEKPSDWERV